MVKTTPPPPFLPQLGRPTKGKLLLQCFTWCQSEVASEGVDGG